jgi:hypothetical protein
VDVLPPLLGLPREELDRLRALRFAAAALESVTGKDGLHSGVSPKREMADRKRAHILGVHRRIWRLAHRPGLRVVVG